MKRRKTIFVFRGRRRGLARGVQSIKPGLLEARRWLVRGCLIRTVLVLGCAGAVAAVAAAAATGFVPQRAAQLEVVSDGAQESVSASFSPRVAAPDRLSFYVPQGYGLSLSASPGTQVGVAVAGALTEPSPSFGDYAAGTLTVGSPTLGTDAVAQACSAGSHAAVWIASLKFERQTIPAVPVRVYADPTSGAESARGAFRLVTCLPSPYVPAVQGGAPQGAQFTSFSLYLSVAGRPATGTYTWRLLTTPYQYGTATPDESSTFEARARVLEPYALTLKASYQPKTSTLIVSGRLLGGGRPRPGIEVDLFVDKSDPTWDVFNIWTAKTRADGSYSLRKRIPKTSEPQVLKVAASVFSVPAACGQPAVVAGGCVDESLSPPADPKTVHVKVPKRG